MAVQLGTILVSIIGMIWSTKLYETIHKSQGQSRSALDSWTREHVFSQDVLPLMVQREVVRVGLVGRDVINEPNEPLMHH